MKNNKEFLEGIYEKAAILQKEKEKEKQRINYKKYIKITSMAAAFLIIVPLLFREQKIPGKYEELPQIIRMLNISDPMSNFQEAEYIIIGETKKINKSQYVKEGNYIYTDIVIEAKEVLLGDIGEEEIILRVNGGVAKKEKVFSKREGDFKKGKKSLLFLQKTDGVYFLVNSEESQFLEVEDKVFIDKEDNKYNIEKIKENIDRRQ